MRKMLLLVALFALGAAGLAGTALYNKATAQNPVQAQHQTCTTDAECTLVQTSGCACLCQRDAFEAVNKNFAQQYNTADQCSARDLKTCATNGACVQLPARCEAGTCTSKPAQ